MVTAELSAGLYAAVQVLIWGGLLPGLLLHSETGSVDPPWRAAPPVVLAAILLATGSVLVLLAGRQLARQGIPLFATRPGPALVTEGWYCRVRNPQDIGILVVALAAPLALDLTLMWAIPAVAAVWLVAGLEPLEDRRLLEQFGDDFRAYRRAVPRWFPSMKG